jgi:hypothetical protein
VLPARAIQELAGRQDFGTTRRYMHLSPAAVRGASLLAELDALEIRVRVQEGRRPGDREVADLKREISARRDLVITYRATCRAADLAGETIH